MKIENTDDCLRPPRFLPKYKGVSCFDCKNQDGAHHSYGGSDWCKIALHEDSMITKDNYMRAINCPEFIQKTGWWYNFHKKMNKLFGCEL